jgi:N-acetylmuramate 1-kinase
MTAITVALANETATILLGNDLARIVAKGDLIALSGDLGAGKTTLARALIRSLAGDPELDVPSPTFTLAQAYGTPLPVSHFDLYRLVDPSELDELGLDEALDDGVAVVEWPERAGKLLPENAIRIEILHNGAGRTALISANGAAESRIRRSLALRGFLAKAGLPGTLRRPFVGDASPRVYELAADANGNDLVLMDQRAAPAGPPVWNGRPYREIAHTTNPTVHPFVAVGEALLAKGFAAPQILARDLHENFLLLEHLGSGSILSDDGKPLEVRYCAAAELLADIHTAGIAQLLKTKDFDWHIPPFDRDALMIETLLALDWYLPYRLGREASAPERTEFTAAWDELFASLHQSRYGLVLRDYHSPNLIWRPAHDGRRRIGVLDFQDALWGPCAYDLASLAQDARATVPVEIETATFDAYAAKRGKSASLDGDWLRREYAVMALQRNTKILGIFIRLDKRDGKSAYLMHLPRIEAYVSRTLKVSGLARLAAFYADMGL